MAREEEIRQMAYRLWEQAGRPEGRDQEFWYQAQRMMDGGERSGNGMETAGTTTSRRPPMRRAGR